MPPSHPDYLRFVARDFSVRAANEYAFGGDSRRTSVSAASDQTRPTQELFTALQNALYLYCHCTPFRLGSDVLSSEKETSLIEDLSRANASQDQWEAGWQIEAIMPTGQVVATHAGTTRTLWPGEYLTSDGPGIPPRAGSVISLFRSRESRTMQQGFYFAFGEAVAASGNRWIRFYVNVAPQGATSLTAAVTRTLNRFDVPFRLKCLSHPSLFGRTDAAVVFVPRRFFSIAIPLMLDVREALNSVMLSETSPLVRELASGLGIAEEPETGESFGMHRARVLAEGLWKAFEEKANSDDGRLEAMNAQFVKYHLDPARPYLNSATAPDVYTSRYTAVDH